MPTNKTIDREQVFDLLQHLTAQLPGFLCAVNLNGTMLYASKHGYDIPDTIGNPADEHIAEEDRAHFWACFRRVIDHREAPTYAVSVNTPAPPGRVRIVGRMFPVLSDAGNLLCVGTICWDATANVSTIPGDAPTSNDSLYPFLLSPDCQRVVACLRAHGPLKVDALARRIGMTAGSTRIASSACRVTVNDLAARGIISKDHEGCNISVGFAPFVSEALRKRTS